MDTTSTLYRRNSGILATLRATKAQRDTLAAALARIVAFETADENDDAFLSIAEDANERGMGAADVRRELIDAARAALAGVRS
jgi:hypothetical protein